MAESIRIVDPYSNAAAEIAPNLGFNCIAFSAQVNDQTVQIIDSPDDVLNGQYRPSGYGIPILFPFPNRIRDGKFRFEEKDYQIPLPENGPNAIHGFCYDRPWRVINQTEDSVTGQFHLKVDAPERKNCWPADFIFDVRYRVAESRLECQFRITNCDKKPLPWGLGTHAYFRLPFGPQSTAAQCELQVPVSEQWELQDYLPTGRRIGVENNAPLRTGAQFGDLKFDDVFTGWQSDGGTVRSTILDPQAGIQLTQICDSQYFREAVVYTPPGRNAVCIEPYTCVTDAINLEPRDINAGLQILPPGKVVQTWTALQVSPILS